MYNLGESPPLYISSIATCTFYKQIERDIGKGDSSVIKQLSQQNQMIKRDHPFNVLVDAVFNSSKELAQDPATMGSLTYLTLCLKNRPIALTHNVLTRAIDDTVDKAWNIAANAVTKNEFIKCVPDINHMDLMHSNVCFYGPEEKFESLRREKTPYIYKPHDILNPQDEDQLNSADDLLKSHLSPLAFTMRMNSLKMQQDMDSRYSINNLDFQSNIGKHTQENDPVCEDDIIKPKSLDQPSASDVSRPREQVLDKIVDVVAPTTDTIIQDRVAEPIHNVTDISQDKLVGNKAVLKQNQEEAKSKASNNIKGESINFNLPANSNPKIEVTEEQERELLDSTLKLTPAPDSSGKFTSGRNVRLDNGIAYVHRTDRGRNIGAGLGGSSARGVNINFQLSIPCTIF